MKGLWGHLPPRKPYFPSLDGKGLLPWQRSNRKEAWHKVRGMDGGLYPFLNPSYSGNILQIGATPSHTPGLELPMDTCFILSFRGLTKRLSTTLHWVLEMDVTEAPFRVGQKSTTGCT